MPEVKIYKIDNFAGGLNLKNDSAVALGGISPSQCIQAVNCDFRDKVSIQTRDGYKKTYADTYEYAIVGIFCYYDNTGQRKIVKAWDGHNYIIYDGLTPIYQEYPGPRSFAPTVFDNQLFFCDGSNENKKYDGTDVTKMGITAPATAAAVAEGASGNLSGDYDYYYSYYNSNTGQESGLSPKAEITVASKKVVVTPIWSSDPQVTHIRLYRAGGDAGPTVDGTPVKRRVDTSLNSGNGELTSLEVAGNVGADLITNGGFDSDTWWSKSNAKVTIASGVANFTTTRSKQIDQGYLYRDYLLTASTKYRLEFEITSDNDKQAWVSVYTKDPAGQQTIVMDLIKKGKYSYDFYATYQGLYFHFRTWDAKTITIDNVTLKTTTLGYTDNIADTSISTTAEDCSTNLVPTAVEMLSYHHQEMFGANNATYPGSLYTSRFYNLTGNENLEAFPATDFVTNIGSKSDPIVAIMPFEIDMMVYTKYKMFRYRYIGTTEEDIIFEEVASIGCASGKSLAEGVLENGMPFHIFLGQSTRGRGIYLFDGRSVFCVSNNVEPIFSGEREDISSINWNYVSNCSGAVHDNKYYLAYPEGSAEWPDKVIIIDFETRPPRFTQADFSAYALHADIIADKLYMGNSDKYLYEFSSSHGLPEEIEIDYQTPYFGDRATFSQLKSLTFHADTKGKTLTVKIWADRVVVATLTTSSTSMERIEIDCPPACIGRTFSVEFICSSNKRVKISPPLELKVLLKEKY